MYRVSLGAGRKREGVPEDERLFGGVRSVLPRAHGRGLVELHCGGRDGTQRSRHDQLSPQPPDVAGDAWCYALLFSRLFL